MPTPRHPDFAVIQQRLRRLDESFYPPRIDIDDMYGPSMARGLDALLDLVEQENGLEPFDQDRAAVKAGKLPQKWQWLLDTPRAPLMVRIALGEYGLKETRGHGNNHTILAWADEVAAGVDSAYADWAAGWFNKDSIPWCGLFMAVVAVRASQGRPERHPPKKYLAALEWEHYGVHVDKDEAVVGDVMVLGRNGGGHVCINVGEEEGGERFFGLGGNQSDAVNILPFDYDRVRFVRRPPYNNRPAGARRVIMGPGGPSSENEA